MTQRIATSAVDRNRNPAHGNDHRCSSTTAANLNGFERIVGNPEAFEPLQPCVP
jgi:hypothetical protein